MSLSRSQLHAVAGRARRYPSHLLGIGTLALVVVHPSLAMPADVQQRNAHALATDRPALVLVYTKQDPRWEAPGHGEHHQFTKPYKPARQPPDSLPPRQHRGRYSSRVLDRFVVLALVAVVVTALTAEWVSASLRLPPAWIPLLCGLVLGPVTGLIDPARLLGTALLPSVSLFFVVMLFADLLRARVADAGNLGAIVARLVSRETVVICAGAAVIGAIIGLGPAPAALLAASLVLAQCAARGEPNDETEPLVCWAGTCLEIVGIVLVLVACEVALAGHLYRDPAPAIRGVTTTVIGGSVAGLTLGYVLVQVLWRGWIAERTRRPLLVAAALAAFALTNLLYEGCGFFAVVALGLSLANQRKVNLVQPNAGIIVPPALMSGLLIVLAAQVHLDGMTTVDAGGLAALLGLLLVARLAIWRSRLPWRAQLALTGGTAATAIVVAAAVLCAARLAEVGVAQAQLVVTLTVLVVFIRLSIASVAGAFGTRWWHAAVAPADVPGEETPAAV